MKPTKLAIIPGDGIGTEVISASVAVLDAIKKEYDLPLSWDWFDWGADKYINEGVALPDGAIKMLSEQYNGILFGAVGDPRIPDMRHGREILLGIRRQLNLYVNYRPAYLNLVPSTIYNESPERNNRVVEIYRENTQGLYQGIGGKIENAGQIDVAIDQSIHTREKVESFLGYVFSKYAETPGRKITLVHKSNAVPNNGKLWLNAFNKIRVQYPGIATNDEYVDAFCYHFVSNPCRFDIVVTSNLFGDIASDIGAALMGGMGLAPSANICPETGFGLFEPVHGSAPDIAGKGISNPTGAIFSAVLMLEHFGAHEAALMLRSALKKKLAAQGGTIDLGGTESTVLFTESLLNIIHGERAGEPRGQSR